MRVYKDGEFFQSFEDKPIAVGIANEAISLPGYPGLTVWMSLHYPPPGWTEGVIRYTDIQWYSWSNTYCTLQIIPKYGAILKHHHRRNFLDLPLLK